MRAPACNFRWLRRAMLMCLACVPLDAVADDAKPKDEPSVEHRIAQGHVLFTRDWKTHTRDDDAADKSPKGDGLGPMYNDVSCQACHNLAGLGGGGAAEKNVQLLHAVRPNLRNPALRRFGFLQRAGTIHPGFAAGQPTLVLHRFGRSPEGDEERYAQFRETLIGKDGRRPLSLEHPLRRQEGIWLQLTERNTSALFGAGLIDAIPDSVLIEVAERQRKIDPEITGRVPQTATGAVGRFGWRGQTATLHDFVLGACAIELGLGVPGHAQTAFALRTSAGVVTQVISDPRQRARGPVQVVDVTVDLTEEQCLDLTAFVASLPAPEPIRRENHLQVSLDVRAGGQLFETIGCSACHNQDLGPAEAIYSDLLLHDMGPGLADPLPATPEITEETVPSSAFGYYGSPGIEQLAKVTTNIQQEWRTPPLWGVRDSAPYLHDGRAETLDDAVRLHGGEAARSRKAYLKLKPDERDTVQTFLQSLAAPGGEPQGTSGGGLGSGFFSTPPAVTNP